MSGLEVSGSSEPRTECAQLLGAAAATANDGGERLAGWMG